MNRLSSQQRKLLYLMMIVVLVIPIIWLGRPATGQVNPQSGESDPGGRLASLRRTHDLGETNLGDIDPTSTTMSFVLLGLRGVATNLLWMEHDEQRRKKQWAEMRATTDSIIKLQPHYMAVWRFHGWNMAYNVSAEWDGVADRYYWVKEGAKFLMKGTQRNQHYTELYWETGRVLGQKIGIADEWRFFRNFFKSDPDVQRFGGGPDPEINPKGQDNYLGGKEWYQLANDVEVTNGQHIMMRAIFRSYPMRAQWEYAESFYREGFFGDVAQEEWKKALKEWTVDYGTQERFQTLGGEIFLEATEKDVAELARDQGREPAEIAQGILRTQDVVNYRYWRTRGQAESEPETILAHRYLYEGEDFFKRGDLESARDSMEEGLKNMTDVLIKFPDLMSEDSTIEEAMWGIMIWQKCLQLLGAEVPAIFPLRDLWNKEQLRLPSLQDDFNRKFGG